MRRVNKPFEISINKYECSLKALLSRKLKPINHLRDSPDFLQECKNDRPVKDKNHLPILQQMTKKTGKTNRNDPKQLCPGIMLAAIEANVSMSL